MAQHRADTAMEALAAAPVLNHDGVNVELADAAPYLAPEIVIARVTKERDARVTKERDQLRANELQLWVAIDVALNLLSPGVSPLIARDYLAQVTVSDPIDARQDMSHWQDEIDRQNTTWTQEDIDRILARSREQWKADADLFAHSCTICGWEDRVDRQPDRRLVGASHSSA